MAWIERLKEPRATHMVVSEAGSSAMASALRCVFLSLQQEIILNLTERRGLVEIVLLRAHLSVL